MVTIDTLRKVAMSFPAATEEPHFEKTLGLKRKYLPPTTG